MTKVICSAKDGNVYFECKGHAEYVNPETGNNDVCVAVSTICSMIVRWMNKHDIDPQVCEDGHVRFNEESISEQTIAVFQAAGLQLEALAEEFPEAIRVY